MAIRVPAGVSLLFSRLHTYRWSLVGAGIIGGVVLLKMWPGALPQAHPSTVAVERAPQMKSTANVRQGFEAQLDTQNTKVDGLVKSVTALQGILKEESRKREEVERLQRDDKAAQAAHAQAQQKQFEDALARTRTTQQSVQAAKAVPAVKKVVTETPTVVTPPPAVVELRTMFRSCPPV